MALVDVGRSGDVAILRMCRPPLNSLDRSLRAAIVQRLSDALADGGVVAIVLTGGDEAFCAGADIQEFAGGAGGDAFAEPWLGAVCDALARSAKPVVAGIAGPCMGGGLELALACAARVVAPNARLALPEIRLGLIPGAGGTQRLPRLVGLESALALILSGETIDAPRAVASGIAVPAERSMLEASTEAARRLARTGYRAPAPAGPADAESRTSGEATIAAARSRLRRALPAELGALDAVRASLGGLDEGLRRETEIFRGLIETPESRALQYAFFSDRAASRIESAVPARPRRTIEGVAIVGAGTMGAGIAMCTANAGLHAVLIDSSSEALRRATSRIEETYAALVRKGRLARAEADRRVESIRREQDLGVVASVDLVIEAVPESLELKQSVFRELDRLARDGAVLATNTSTLDVNEIGRVTRRPEDVIGLHFFSPANVMRLLEVVRTDATAPDVIASCMSFAKRIGKVAVVARVCDGFIGNRMFEEYTRQAFFLLDEGALPSQVDRALERWGMAMGPFAVLDLAGGDIAWAIRKRRAVQYPDQPYSRLPDRVCELGRFGQKTGAGFYRYDSTTRARSDDPEIDALVEQHSATLGMQRRAIDDDEIVARCVLALVNEGARLLEEGVAQRASDVDVVYRHGYGFPADRGGPMHYADELGLTRVVDRMRSFASGYQGRFWNVAPLLLRCAEAGTRLSAAAPTR